MYGLLVLWEWCLFLTAPAGRHSVSPFKIDGVPPEDDVSHRLTEEDGEEDIPVEVHAEQHA
jgi:hypothetical protein